MSDFDNDKTVLLAHGGGGKMTAELIRTVFASQLGNPILDRMDDAATMELQGRLAFTVDGHVVSPLFFPGGDIGRLSVTGTVNDLAMVGAAPLYLSAGFIIEDGLPLSDLERIVGSMAAAAREAGVQVVAGDTKVVEHGAADGVYITTSGIGVVPPGVRITCSAARPGDVVILSGAIGDHGMAVLSRRGGLEFDSQIKSDCAPLNSLVRTMLDTSRRIRVLRDPTRGGVAAGLNEIAQASGVAIEIDEAKLPVNAPVRAACEMLGLDPLMLANEGKLMAIVAAQDAEQLLAAMRQNCYGEAATVIGRVEQTDRPRVFLRTALGSRRVLTMPVGELLPRIC